METDPDISNILNGLAIQQTDCVWQIGRSNEILTNALAKLVRQVVVADHGN